MRLLPIEIEVIQSSFKKHFGANDHLWLFGSRMDDAKKGGDIDLYIETNFDPQDAFDAKHKFAVDLQIILGEQKIDVVLNCLKSDYHAYIYEHARETGGLV